MHGFGGDMTGSGWTRDEELELIESVRLLLRRVGELERKVHRLENKGVDE